MKSTFATLPQVAHREPVRIRLRQCARTFAGRQGQHTALHPLDLAVEPGGNAGAAWPLRLWQNHHVAHYQRP